VIIPKMDYEKLFEPYTVDGHSIENAIRFLIKEAKLKGINEDLVPVAVQEVMFEVQNGKHFSLNKCPCGCGIDKAGTAITHAMLERLKALDWNLQAEIGKFFEQRSNLKLTEFFNGQKKIQKDKAKQVKKRLKQIKKTKK